MACQRARATHWRGGGGVRVQLRARAVAVAAAAVAPTNPLSSSECKSCGARAHRHKLEASSTLGALRARARHCLRLAIMRSNALHRRTGAALAHPCAADKKRAESPGARQATYQPGSARKLPSGRSADELASNPWAQSTSQVSAARAWLRAVFQAPQAHPNRWKGSPACLISGGQHQRKPHLTSPQRPCVPDIWPPPWTGFLHCLAPAAAPAAQLRSAVSTNHPLFLTFNAALKPTQPQPPTTDTPRLLAPLTTVTSPAGQPSSSITVLARVTSLASTQPSNVHPAFSSLLPARSS